MLGSIIAVIVFLFGALVVIKRIQFIKQTSLTNIHGKCMALSSPLRAQIRTLGQSKHDSVLYDVFIIFMGN